MKSKEHRQYKGKGNRHNRFKRDAKKLLLLEKYKDRRNVDPGFKGFRWQT